MQFGSTGLPMILSLETSGTSGTLTIISPESHIITANEVVLVLFLNDVANSSWFNTNWVQNRIGGIQNLDGAIKKGDLRLFQYVASGNYLDSLGHRL